MGEEKKYVLKWKKVLKIFGFSILGIIVLANLLVILSGKFYLYKAVGSTYLRGQSGPDIYDSTIFYNRPIDNLTIEHWNYHTDNYNLTEEELGFLGDYETTSFLVIKENTVLHESYYENHEEWTRSNSFSMAKSIISLLIGIAVDQGHIKSIDDPVYKYLDHFELDGKKDVTIRHLLNMSAGLSWDESSSALSDNAEAYYGWNLSRKVTEMKSVEKPGKIYEYKSGYTQVLGFLLEQTTGESVSQYASENLWKLIGAESPAFWSLDDDNGMEKSFCCFYAITRDFARIGKLANNYGKWNGKTIVSSSYMREMIRPARDLTRRNGMKNDIYGLSWWVVQGEGEQVFYARGILGQYIICLPARKLVIVRTGHLRGNVPRDAVRDFRDPEYRKVEHPEEIFYYLQMGKRIDRLYSK